uniref:Uncharacterized protein n=1 Tax=Arundo donax TaxID=35708 RepID=A0A0A9BNW9_ARUDO
MFLCQRCLKQHDYLN